MASRGPKGPRTDRIVLRFALTSLLVFAVVGVVIVTLRARDLRTHEEAVAADRSELVAQEVIAPALWEHPTGTVMQGQAYADLAALVTRVKATDPGIMRVKVWGPDGTVLFSDEPKEVGQNPGLGTDLQEAFDEGIASTDISNLTAAENVNDRQLANKLFESYVPVRRTAAGPVEAVVEVYRDYATIQSEIDRLTRTLVISLAAGLLILYIVMVPVMVGVTRRLRQQNDKLAEQADQLSSLLEGEQRTVAELRELDRLKDDFVAAASHELRTPLTSIRGYANLLRNPHMPRETTDEAVDAIERQTSRMMRLVTNLLRESKIERDAVTTGPVLFDVATLVDEVATDFHSDGLRLRIQVSADLPEVRCDRAKVGDVLTNLVDNALKYSPAGTPIEIGAAIEDAHLAIWVRDHGPGIDPGDVPHIFERFYQADQTATRRHGGVGLGLHIVHGLVASMHGSIRVGPTDGGGATFRFQVPLVAAGDDEGTRSREEPSYSS